MFSNQFSVLTEDTNSEKEGSTIQKQKWGDVDDDEPLVGVPTTYVKDFNNDTDLVIDNDDKNDDKNKQQEEQNNTKLLDIQFSKLNELTVVYNTKSYDKTTNKVESLVKSRKLRVVSKATYEGLKKIINKYNPQKKSYLDMEEQNEKIKLTNNFMEMTYKDPNVPLQFVYPVVIIHLRNGKDITRNDIKPKSRCDFSVSDIYYKVGPARSPQYPAHNM